MPRVINKIEFKVSDKITDGKKITISTDFGNKHFMNVGNFTGFMQYYGVDSDIVVKEYNGKLGITDSKIK